MKLRALCKNIVQAAPPVAARETGGALAGFTDPVSTRPPAIMTPSASCSPYISMDDFMASPGLLDSPLQLVDDAESNPGGMVSAMDIAPYNGAPIFETLPPQELEKTTGDFQRTTTDPLYDSASTDSGGGSGNFNRNLKCSNVVGQGPGRDFRKSSMDDGRNQALRIAISNGHASMVQLLVKHGADVNAPIGPLSRTPLHDAAAGADAKIVELLLKHGADASIWDAGGMTALQIAVSADNINVAEVLLRPNVYRGGRCNKPDGVTPDFDSHRHNDDFSFPD